MERYTKWRDAGTGVAPFLPVSGPEATAATLPLRIVTFIVKLPLVLVAGLLFILVDCFFRFSLGSVSRGAFEFSRSWAARIFLFVCGFYRIPVSYDNRKSTKPKDGDFVVVNQSSPMDVLLLTYMFPAAVFTRFDNEMLFETQSALSAFFSRFRYDRARKGCSINDLTSNHSMVKDRVIAVFPECTTSNNRGLLSFCPLMLESAYVVCIKHNNPAYLTTPLPGTYWQFFWALCSLWSHGCRVKCSSQKVHEEYADTIARFGRIPKTSLGIDDKSAFLQAWQKR